jgi:hypothetical protein
MAQPPITIHLHLAEYLTKYGHPVPIDPLTQRLEAGGDIQKYQ